MIRQLLKIIIDSWIRGESYFVKSELGGQKKLLIIRKDGLGDYILFYPALKYYKELYPQHRIFLMVSRIAKDFSRKMKEADELIYFDNKRFSSDFFYRRNFLLALKKAGYDIAIYPVYSREEIGDFMVWLTQAREKIGFSGDNGCIAEEKRLENNKIYTKLIDAPQDLETEFGRNMHFVKSLGAAIPAIDHPVLELEKKESEEAEKILAENGINGGEFVVLYPGAGQTYKMWPAERYAEVIRFLAKRNLLPVVCGFGAENKIADRIRTALSGDGWFIDLVGKLDIFTLAGLLKKSAFYLGSDTGVLHLASAVGAPAICLMGGGHFGRFFPYGNMKKNRVVYDKSMKCKNDNWKCSEGLSENEAAPCIAGITAEDVKIEIDKFLNCYE